MWFLFSAFSLSDDFLSHRSLHSWYEYHSWLSSLAFEIPFWSNTQIRTTLPRRNTQTEHTERLSFSKQVNKAGVIAKEGHRLLSRNRVRSAPGIRSKMRCFPGLMSLYSRVLAFSGLFWTLLLKQIFSLPLFISSRRKEEMNVAETFLDGRKTYLFIVPTRSNCLNRLQRKVGVCSFAVRFSVEMWFLLRGKIWNFLVAKVTFVHKPCPK